MAGRWLDAHSALTVPARELLVAAANRLALSARGYHRVLKVARTISDLDEREEIGETQIAEALRYRPVLASTEAPPFHAAVAAR